MATVRVIPVGMCDATYLLQRTGANRVESVTMSYDPESAVDQSLANSLHNSFVTHMIPALAAAYTFMSVHLLGRSDAVNLVAVDSTQPPAVGTRSGSLIGNLGSPQVAALIRKHTAFAGKAQRGRLYWPGVAEGDVDGHGKLTGAVVTALESAVDAWFSNVNTYAQHMLGHSCFHEDDQPPCQPIPWTPITHLSVDDVVATQRRRLAR